MLAGSSVKETPAQLISDPDVIVTQVRLAFAERRKMLRNTLQSRFTAVQVTDALAAAGIPLSARPQQLRLQDYIALWQHLPRTRAAQSRLALVGDCQTQTLHHS